MSISIYKIDSSKLIPIGKDGHQKGQEQAKTYFDEVPKGDFTVAITGEELINKLGSMADLDLRGNNRILVSVDNEDVQRVGMTIYYYDRQSETAKHFTVSHVNCKEESDYDLANRLMESIEDAFCSGKEKKNSRAYRQVDDLIANAESQKKEKGCGEKRLGRDVDRE